MFEKVINKFFTMMSLFLFYYIYVYVYIVGWYLKLYDDFKYNKNNIIALATSILITHIFS